MARDGKYGDIEIPGIPDDEPIFVLRAQDVLAIPTLVRYENFRINVENDTPTQEWLADLEAQIERFGEWAKQHADKMKVPD